MHIAIIGTGISGLTAAYHLAGDHRLTIFEAADHVGGHTNTIDVEVDDERHAIDTGFIVFNERNYPNFSRLLSELEVPSQPTTMSFSVRCDRTGLEYNGTSLDTVFAQRRNLLRPSFHRMLLDILRFNRQAPSMDDLPDDRTTVADYVARHGYSDRFVDQYLVPLGASLWSCPPRTFRSFPMRFVIEFLKNHAMLQVDGRPTWRVVRGGLGAIRREAGGGLP